MVIWCHRLSNNKLQQASESRDPRNRKQLLTLLAPRTWPAERQSLNHHMCTWLTCPFWTVSPDPASFIKCATVCGQQTNKQNPFGVIPALTNGHGALLLGRLCVTMSWLGVLFFCLLIGCLYWNDLCVLMFHWLLVLPCFKLNCQN